MRTCPEEKGDSKLITGGVKCQNLKGWPVIIAVTEFVSVFKIEEFQFIVLL